jgi:hypothetical protein
MSYFEQGVNIERQVPDAMDLDLESLVGAAHPDATSSLNNQILSDEVL